MVPVMVPAVVPVAVVVMVVVRAGAVAVALLAEHRQAEQLARLLERCQGVDVWHITDVNAIHLKRGDRGD